MADDFLPGLPIEDPALLPSAVATASKDESFPGLNAAGAGPQDGNGSEDSDGSGVSSSSEEFAHVPVGHYVLALRAQAGFKTLHRVGSCWRRPGVDYGRFQDLGVALPSPERYSSACKTCFGRAGILQTDEPVEESASSGDSSEASS